MLSTLPDVAQQGTPLYHHGYETEAYKVRLAAKRTELQTPISDKRNFLWSAAAGGLGSGLQTSECRWNENLSGYMWVEVPSLGS